VARNFIKAFRTYDDIFILIAGIFFDKIITL
jgi:hypothetical protein